MATPPIAYRATSCLLGAVLFITGALKADAWQSTPALALGSWDSPLFAVLEILAGLWMLFGLFPGWTRVLAVVGFTALLGVSLDKAFAGDPACAGCFGRVPINPWVTTGFDTLAILSLVLCSPLDPPPHFWRTQRRRLFVFGAISPCIVVATFVAAQYRAPAMIDDDGNIPEGYSTVALDPGNWTGKRLSLLKHIDTGNVIARGRWVVLFHQHNCPVCKDAIPQYVQLAYELAERSDPVRVALVEVPPFPNTNRQPSEHSRSVCIHGRLSAAKQWQGRMPIVLLLQNGVVGAVSHDPDTLLRMTVSSRTEQTVEAGDFESPNYRQAQRNRYLGEIACGPLAILEVLRSLRIPLTAEETEDLLSAGGEHGTTLAQLKELVEGKGLFAAGVAVAPADLPVINLPAVVHDGKFGFAAVTGYKTDGIQVVYPFKRPGVLSVPDFEKVFGSTCRVLLISTNSIPGRLTRQESFPPEPGPRLRLEGGVLSVGRIYQRHWQATLRLYNDGDSDLCFRDLRVGCPYVSATLDRPLISPGRTAVLKVVGTQTTVGGFACNVRVTTNQHHGAEVAIPVRGYLEQPVLLRKPALTLHGILIGQEVRSEVDLDVARGFDPTRAPVRIPASAPLSAKLNCQDGKWKLLIRWHGSAAIGWHRHRIEVCSDDTPNAVVSPLLLALQVVPEIEVSPPSLWLNADEAAGAWQRQVRFKFNSPQQHQFNLTASRAGFTELLRCSRTEDRYGGLTASLSPAKPGALKAFIGQSVDVEFRFDGGIVQTITIHVVKDGLR